MVFRSKYYSTIVLILVFANVSFAQNLANERLSNYKILKEENGSVEIPFRMHNNKPLFDLSINGRKATLMIDNGVLWDPVWLFGSRLVEELKLVPTIGEEPGGAEKSKSTFVYESSHLNLQFENIVFYNQPTLISPSDAGFTKMFPGADGQLCNTFFKNFIVEFNFIHHKVLLHDPKVFNYNGKGSVLDMTLTETGTYSIPFSLTLPNGKTYNDKVDIDLGGIHELKIALNNTRNIKLPDNALKTNRNNLTGMPSEYKGKIESMMIGKYEFTNPTVDYGDETTSRIHPLNLGRIGLPLFMKFKVIFDYFNNKVYLEPNENFDGEIKE